MNTSPYFSVVIPVYNKEPHIARCIESVLNQTWQDFELLLVCDPSTDNSLAEINKYDDSRIRVYHRDEPGPGGYAARNLGIKQAKAAWIAFLDADDEWLPDHLASMKQLIDQYPDDQVFCCAWETYDPSVTKQPYLNAYSRSSLETNPDLTSHQLSLTTYLDAVLRNKRPIWTSIAVLSKDILQQNNGFPDGQCKRGGDIDTWLKCIADVDSIVWSAHIGAIYFNDSVNMVTRTTIDTPTLCKKTTDDLLPKFGLTIATKLKQRSNLIILRAWSLNMQVGAKQNFALKPLLYLESLPLKGRIILFLSTLPYPLNTILFKCLYRINHWKNRMKLYYGQH